MPAFGSRWHKRVSRSTLQLIVECKEAMGHVPGLVVCKFPPVYVLADLSQFVDLLVGNLGNHGASVSELNDGGRCHRSGVSNGDDLLPVESAFIS